MREDCLLMRKVSEISRFEMVEETVDEEITDEVEMEVE